MPDTDSTPESQKISRGSLAPENHNDEQYDEDAQAQTVSADARDRDTGDYADPLESMKVKHANLDDDSTQDLIDHMRDMEQSGRIDMGAYRGEDNMDDNEDKYGEENRLDNLRSDGT